MAPINFEDKIKETLEKRQITPNDNSWETLSNRLDKEGAKEKNKGFWWLSIAASFIGILIVTIVMINRNTTIESNSTKPTIVDVEIPSDIINIEKDESNDRIQKQNDETLASTNNEESVNENKAPLKQKEGEIKNEIQIKEKEIIAKEINESKVLASTEVKTKTKETESSTELSPLSIEDQKLNAVVAEIKRLDEANPNVIDNEVDELLREAQREIKLQKLYEQAIKTVNADDLLKDVETDLDNSFRDRVFKALASGFKEVKTAVANRNN